MYYWGNINDFFFVEGLRFALVAITHIRGGNIHNTKKPVGWATLTYISKVFPTTGLE